jgi:hypothetical protein
MAQLVARIDWTSPMKIQSPVVTLLAGVVLAAIVTFLSVRAHQSATSPAPEPSGTTNPYSIAVVGVAA